PSSCFFSHNTSTTLIHPLSLHDALPISFKPDGQIFESLDFSFDVLAQRLRELAFLNKGLSITLTDERREKQEVFRYKGGIVGERDRKSTRLNSSHGSISYAVFCLKKKNI